VASPRKSLLQGRGASVESDQNNSGAPSPTTGSLSRRGFLGCVGTSTAVVAASSASLPSLLAPEYASAEEIGPVNDEQRRSQAYQVRLQTAVAEKNIPLPSHLTNGDEQLYANKVGNYSKALPHNSLGEVDTSAYDALINALTTGSPNDFEAIPLGGTVKLVNPQASYAFLLEGVDSHATGMVAPPAFASPEQGGEMAEDYWMALTRDVPYSQYGSEPLTQAAIADLNGFPNYAGVDAESLFRGTTTGDLTGPFVSQFLLPNVPYGATTIVQQYRVPLPGTGNDFLTGYEAWLNCQNGGKPTAKITYDPTPRYVRSGRDLGEWVHQDFPYNGPLNALLILLGMKAAVDAGNPYLSSATQTGFVTFGQPMYFDFLVRVCEDSLKATWFQKWLVHRRVRPEAFAGSVHNTLKGVANYPISPLLLHSQAVQQVFHTYGSYLLAMAYAEGCPTHTSYPAGHAVIAGACVTFLKAVFDENFIIPNPVVASDDGLSLLPYSGPPLTLRNELNKLASNIALARDVAGVHWRSDGIQGLLFGETVAISVLRDYRSTYNETFSGFSLTKFDGTMITV
jgi:membrane-associated phospholipid phosphatase